MIIDNIIVGEAGDVLIVRSYHANFLPSVPFEEVNEGYLRLLGLPPIRQTGSVYNPLILLTTDGSLMMISNKYPTPLPIPLDLPPIKELINVGPLGVLDINNTLHFLDILSIIKEQLGIDIDIREGGGVINYLYPDIPERSYSIENVQNISYGYAIPTIPHTSSRIPLVILLYDNHLIKGFSENIVRGNYKITNLSDKIDRLINNLLVYSNNIIRPIRGSNTHIKIGHKITLSESLDIKDIAMYSRPNILYIMDYQGNIIRHIGSRNDILDIDFNPVRFLIKAGGDIAIEDDGGNIYDIDDSIHEIIVTRLNIPIRLINPSENRGRMLKSARNVAKINQ